MQQSQALLSTLNISENSPHFRTLKDIEETKARIQTSFSHPEVSCIWK
jgi:hypothetical protein